MPIKTQFHAILPAPIATSSSEALLLDAAGEKAAVIFRAPKDGNLLKVHFRLGIVTTGQTLKASFQNVDPATGAPDGVVDQSGTVTVADTDDNLWKTVTMGAARAVVRSELVACVIEFDAAVGNLNILRSNVSNCAHGDYSALFTGAWALSANSGMLAIEYDDGSFGVTSYTLPGLASTLGVTNATVPDEVGVRFSVPFPLTCAGMVVAMALTGDFDLVLYDSDGSTVLASRSVDKDEAGAVASGVAREWIFQTPVRLSANKQYRAVIKPTSGTTVNVRYVQLNVSTWMAQMPGGVDWIWTQRTDAGAWSEDNTRRTAIGLVASAFGTDTGYLIGG